MATTTDELLEAAETEEESTDSTLVIDWDTREITIPESITCLGVEADEDTTRLYFQCPATYGEFDISTFGIRVNYANYNSSGTQITLDTYQVDDAVSDGENITFSWLVGRRAYAIKGYTTFIVCCQIYDDNESDGIANELNTTLASLPVLEGLEPDGSSVDEETLDIITQILSKTTNLEELIESASTATEVANTAAEAANTAVSLIYSDKNFYYSLNDDGSISLVYADDDENLTYTDVPTDTTGDAMADILSSINNGFMTVAVSKTIFGFGFKVDDSGYVVMRHLNDDWSVDEETLPSDTTLDKIGDALDGIISSLKILANADEEAEE